MFWSLPVYFVNVMCYDASHYDALSQRKACCGHWRRIDAATTSADKLK